MIFIKIENLTIGMILKNYTHLCEVLETETKPRGNSRIKQMNWFAEHFSHIRQGNKIIITEIFNKAVVPMVDMRGGSFNTVEYTKNIEMLILDILAQDKHNGVIFLSKNKLFRILEMVNDNYLDTNRRIPKLSRFLGIEEYSAQEWFDTTGGLLERNLNSALKKLASQSLIFWSREITVSRIVDIPKTEYLVETKHKNLSGETYSTYETHIRTKSVVSEATDEEKKFILATERNVMSLLACNDKQEVIAKGLWAEYERKIKAIIKKDHRISFYYQSYKIIFNPDHILNKQYQMNNLILNSEERRGQKSLINTSLIERSETNAKARQNRALDKVKTTEEFLLSDKILNRTSDQYIEDNIKLNENLIDRKAKDIRKEVKKVKLD